MKSIKRKQDSEELGVIERRKKTKAPSIDDDGIYF